MRGAGCKHRSGRLRISYGVGVRGRSSGSEFGVGVRGRSSGSEVGVGVRGRSSGAPDRTSVRSPRLTPSELEAHAELNVPAIVGLGGDSPKARSRRIRIPQTAGQRIALRAGLIAGPAQVR